MSSQQVTDDCHDADPVFFGAIVFKIVAFLESHRYYKTPKDLILQDLGPIAVHYLYFPTGVVLVSMEPRCPIVMSYPFVVVAAVEI